MSAQSELDSEIEILRSMFDNEITIHRKSDSMVVDYVTTCPNTNKIKLIFAFKMNKIAQTIIISLKNTSRSKHNLTAQSIETITSKLNTKFQQEIDDMPMFQCIQYFNDELKHNSLLFKSKSDHHQLNKPVPNVCEEKQSTAEYIAFIRFNHLFHGKQHKKETQMLSELKNTNCLFGYYFYGKPGIICIGATAKIIKTFAKTCNQIGKKSIIAFVHDYQQKHDIKSVRTVSNISNQKLDRDELQELLTKLGLHKISNILSDILTGTGTDFGSENHGNEVQTTKKLYDERSKYIFEVEIKTSNGPYATTNGSLYMSIIGQDDVQLVDRYKFEMETAQTHKIKQRKKSQNMKFKFEFDDIVLLNKIGVLRKIYFENDSKDSWQCEWIKVSVYQELNKNKPKLKQQYEARLKKWVNKNCPRYAYLSIIK
eukprot:660460_1